MDLVIYLCSRTFLLPLFLFGTVQIAKQGEEFTIVVALYTLEKV